MTDRDKAIKGLEYCTEQGTDCRADCPYINAQHDWMTCKDFLMLDALALLKTQEPITPIHTDKYTRAAAEITFEFKCAICDTGLMKHWVSCPNCGTEIKWDD